MDGSLLIQLVVFLAVAAFAAPVAKTLKLGSILGYLLAGAFIGPYGAGKLLGYSPAYAETLRHIAELGVAMFLFLIGLELRLKRLWKMRDAVFGAGFVQLIGTAALLVVLIWGINPSSDLSFSQAVLVGLALALSSTALLLQTLEEKDDFTLGATAASPFRSSCSRISPRFRLSRSSRRLQPVRRPNWRYPSRAWPRPWRSSASSSSWDTMFSTGFITCWRRPRCAKP